MSPFLVGTTNIVQETEGESVTVWIAQAVSIRKKNESDVCFSVWTQHFVFFEQWVAL